MTDTVDLEMFMVKLRTLVNENDPDTLFRNNPLMEAKKPEIKLLYEELGYLIGSCFKTEEQLHDQRLIEAARQAEDIVDMFISSAIIMNENLQSKFEWVSDSVLDCSLKDLKRVMDDLMSIRADIMTRNLIVNRKDMMMCDKLEATRTTCASGNSSVTLSTTQHEEFIVGFEYEALLILDRLTGDRKKLDVISIVGMGGLGKTTLATKIFNDSFVKYHFDKRGWAAVSQAYSKRDLLLQLLASIGKSVDKEATDSKLCQVLYQSLKGRRYLIVIDDIWSREAWDDVQICFPDDKTGSRVLVTTRLTEVSLHISPGGFTHKLQHLTEDHSWELLCKKTFRGHECPESLIETGKHIARKCGGLPLALVVIAGVLEKGGKKKDLWEKIEESVGSYIINDHVGCLDTLALSYDHLPSHLKKCFLYTGGFPEDYKIQVRRLIRLWMAEGFIKEAGQRSLEKEGEYYLMDLIDRNLVIVAGKSSNGGVKSCRVHDLLREVCLIKACEENFLKKVSMPTSNRNLDSDSVSRMVKQRRLFTDTEVLSEIHSHGYATHTRSALCFRKGHPDCNKTTSWFGSFLLLRVLDLLNIPIVSFSSISILLHLRYLAVWSYCHEFSFSNAYCGSLETLIVKGMLCSFIYSPNNMVNLRHLRCDIINIPIDFSDRTFFNLQTISRLILDHRTQFLLESFPYVKKLGCSVSSKSTNHGLLSFALLTHLEALNIDTYMRESFTLANPIRFPETLRKLTLSGLYLPWSHMSTIQQLPKLEVLKLLESSFRGHLWETGDEPFHQLKFLKLEKLNIRFWEASSIDFPRLRKLVVRSCKDLSEIPLVLGNISTLEHIDIDDSNCVIDSVNRIQEEQREIGNSDIHVNIPQRGHIRKRLFLEVLKTCLP